MKYIASRTWPTSDGALYMRTTWVVGELRLQRPFMFDGQHRKATLVRIVVSLDCRQTPLGTILSQFAAVLPERVVDLLITHAVPIVELVD